MKCDQNLKPEQKTQGAIKNASSSKFYWVINQRSYTINGTEKPAGRMKKMRKGDRRIMNPDWREATEEEVRTKQYYKGDFFNLMAWR